MNLSSKLLLFLVLPFISTSHKGGPILVEDTFARNKFQLAVGAKDVYKISSITDKRSARQGHFRDATLNLKVKA